MVFVISLKSTMKRLIGERKKAGDIMDGATLPTFIDKTYGTTEGMFFVKG